ncbi:UDP-2,4-diacetamido-2,4,6-trideoxy-beta-L-altropyranose hydrolase [Lysinibacillus sphaericus]|uniref:Pseudaminic acid biosynthesis-associated protein PseG n=1 Tax=Lysinibacillus sphaericus OT4b.31 TaxID=1285586 RepID=R7Z8E0_LYSSH|nr:UDP-2,4-diacetamido-2,4,6-trideoxy-beta-L-altropyranose hydrolase [Lysinibacillus sphaericus]EON70440.1 pseudaminic acid biosynthesis-associated protein PseG [Lysinibacillus sphaericus OT4b.31]
MSIFIRVDASTEIGTGHVIRCLTLANRLKKEGKTVAFICRHAEGDCMELIEQQGFYVYKLRASEGSLWTYVADYWKEDARETINILRHYKVEQLIVDHYSIDIKWEQVVRPFTKEIMVIDDLANRPHDCDELLDQNFYLNKDSRYNGLVPVHTRLLLGPKHALLREEFKEARKIIKSFTGKVERIFVFFGGSDPTNETEKVLRAILPIIHLKKIEVDVVVGNSNPNKMKIREVCSTSDQLTYHCQINNMAELMVKADLAIGAGGATTWERIYLHLPTIVIAVADNQVKAAEDLAEINAIVFLGMHNSIREENISSCLRNIISDKVKMKKIIRNLSTI